MPGVITQYSRATNAPRHFPRETEEISSEKLFSLGIITIYLLYFADITLHISDFKIHRKTLLEITLRMNQTAKVSYKSQKEM